MRTPQERLADVLTAITRITTAEVQLGGEHHEMALGAVLWNLVVIGEAVKALPADSLAERADVPWQDVVGMRNVLAHQYFRVNADLVRRTIDAPLALLREACEALLADWS